MNIGSFVGGGVIPYGYNQFLGIPVTLLWDEEVSPAVLDIAGGLDEGPGRLQVPVVGSSAGLVNPVNIELSGMRDSSSLVIGSGA